MIQNSTSDQSMGTTSSNPTVAEERKSEDSYMSTTAPGIPKSADLKMALAFDAQLQHQDDLGHDTLMGLQELDSHLAIFEDSVVEPVVTASDTQDSLSDLLSDVSYSIIEAPSIVHLNGVNDRNSLTQDEFAPPPTIAAQGGLTVGGDGETFLAPKIPLANGNVRIKVEDHNTSKASSMTTEPSETFSALSSSSSKATSPTGYDTSREATHASSQTSSQKPVVASKPRQKYDIRPKASIPTDLAPSEYARQCIAAAESSRLNPYSLHIEEHTFLRMHLSLSQVTTYLNIRNGILRLWTRNPLIGVLRDEAIGCARDARWFDVASVCYEWLVRKAYINFGCLENMSSRYPTKSRGPKRKRKTVAVIGAGMSGLGCARQLEGLFAHFEDRFREQGEDIPKVVVLEGRDRIGGRVYSRGLHTRPDIPSKLEDGSRYTAEMGGMIITGFDRGNPLNILVRGQLALPYRALKPETTLYDSNGQPVDSRRDQLAESLYNDVLERVSDYKFKVAPPLDIEGDKALIDACRDGPSDSQKTMREVEEAAPTIPQGDITSAPRASTFPPVQNSIQVVPVSSDRITGRAHLESGIPAAHRAAFKARSMGWTLKDGVYDDKDLDLGAAVAAKGATLGSVIDEAIQQYRDVVHILPLDLRLLNWHIANLEYSNAINYNELSLGGWDVDAGNEWEGKHTWVTGGYQQVPRGLLHCPQPLNVRKKSIIRNITYAATGSSGPSRIQCEDGTVLNADYIVSSVPLGVLKKQMIQFEPALPSWKTGAIERIGFGILNKVVLVYKKPFWDTSRDIFGVLRDPLFRASLDQHDYTHRRGRFFQWFNSTNTSGVPTLIALMAGDAAFQTEMESNEYLVAEATMVLRSVFGDAVPEPAEVVVTRWGQDKFAHGSYSYTGPNFRHDDYDMMAKPIGNLFFAGEHTCGTHPATVHGAYISGLRAASEVLESMIGPIDIPEPLLVPKENPANLKRKASELARQGASDPKQARLEAYEIEIWTAIYKELGDPPWRPAKISANPYILYGKDNFDAARKKCEEGRRPGKAKPVPNEVRIMLAKMWKEASEEEKRPYNENAISQKKNYAAAVAEYSKKAAQWDRDALAFRKVYEAEHPSLPGPKEKEILWDSPPKRDRKAKRLSGYAEDSASGAEG